MSCSGNTSKPVMRTRLLALSALLGVFAMVVPVAAQDPTPPRLTDLRLMPGALDDLGPRSEPAPPPQRLEFGVFDLGVKVAPRRLSTALISPDMSMYPAASRYRLADPELPQTDIGFDLRLRWPTVAAAGESRLSHLQPYLSLGPALSMPLGEEPLALARPLTRVEPATSLGVRGAIGLTWQVAPDASLFGEYRLTQERPFGARGSGDLGVDLFYGFSLKF
jgi:hypothetical protein